MTPLDRELRAIVARMTKAPKATPKPVPVAPVKARYATTCDECGKHVDLILNRADATLYGFCYCANWHVETHRAHLYRVDPRFELSSRDLPRGYGQPAHVGFIAG